MNAESPDNASLEEGSVIGLGTTLLLQVEGASERLVGIVAGLVPWKCLIVRGQFDGAEGPLVAGGKVAVRYTHDGAMNAFGAEWLGAITAPAELAFITYPESIKTIELRAHKRRECFLPAELVIRNESYLGAIQDISEKGCKFILDISGGRQSPPSIGESERVILVVEAPEGEEKQEISGEARNVRFQAEFDTEKMHVGVRFQDDTAQSLEKIVSYVSAAEPF